MTIIIGSLTAALGVFMLLDARGGESLVPGVLWTAAGVAMWAIAVLCRDEVVTT